MMKLDENGVFRGRIMRNVLLSASRGVALLSAVAFAVLAGGVYAAGVATWTDASGDHLWNNAANWEPNAVANWQNEIHIPSGTWTIDIGAGERYYGLLIIDEGSGSVTFTGSGTLQRSTIADLSIGADAN